MSQSVKVGSTGGIGSGLVAGGNGGNGDKDDGGMAFENGDGDRTMMGVLKGSLHIAD